RPPWEGHVAMSVETSVLVEPRAPARPRSRAASAIGRVGRELAVVAAGYAGYAWIRDENGEANAHATERARAHGEALSRPGHHLHLDVERAVQHGFLHAKPLLQILGGFYGSAHFLVTLGVLVWLVVRRPAAYRTWRTVLAVSTAAALAVFAFYPVM